MGAWGAGLYANDMAADLRSTISAVVRLPLSVARIVEILCESYPGAAESSEDEDHSTFWLVVADRLHRSGIESEDAFDRAKNIIDTGMDLSMSACLGLDESGLRKREKNLQILRDRISQPVPSKHSAIVESNNLSWQQRVNVRPGRAGGKDGEERFRGNACDKDSRRR